MLKSVEAPLASLPKIKTYYGCAQNMVMLSGVGDTCSQPATPANPKWPTGSGKRSNPRLLDPPSNFC